MLTAKRDAAAANRFLRKALRAVHTQEPRVINVDTVDKGVGTPDPNNLKNAAYPKAIDELKEKEELAQSVELRQNKYLNNIVELSASGDKAISQTRDRIWVIQYGTPNVKGV